MACLVLHNYCRIRNINIAIDQDIADHLRRDRDLRRFHEPELIRTNEDEAGEQRRGEELRQRVVASFS